MIVIIIRLDIEPRRLRHCWLVDARGFSGQAKRSIDKQEGEINWTCEEDEYCFACAPSGNHELICNYLALVSHSFRAPIERINESEHGEQVKSLAAFHNGV